MTEPSVREIAKWWFEILKSAPHANSWVIEDSFVERLAVTWPWVQVYFELLDMTKEREFPRVVTLGVYALQETLGLRPDCAAALFLLLSRVSCRLSGQIPLEEKIEPYSKIIDQLVKQENEKADKWLRWFREAMGEGGKDGNRS